MNEEFIKTRLVEHYNEVVAHYGEDAVLGVFLYGSQNYGCATAASDVDTKAILIPSFADLCLNKPVAKELHIGEEHCEVKDIREMVKMWKKQNLNFLEILYTDYFILNPSYRYVWDEFIKPFREEIVNYNKPYMAKSLQGQILNNIKRDNNKMQAKAVRTLYQLGHICHFPSNSFDENIKLDKEERDRYFYIREMGLTEEKKNDYIEVTKNFATLLMQEEEDTSFGDFMLDEMVLNICRIRRMEY